jgi:BlaI family transcriptional regulator, penicillinase repressor
LVPPHNRSRQLTRLELLIMSVLWDLGPSTVQEVRKRLGVKPTLAYTTVQTMLNVLLRKGRVTRTLEGKAYRYCAVFSRAKAITQTLNDLVDRLFGGSVEALAMNLLVHRELDRSKLERLNSLIQERLKRDREAKDGLD